MKSRTATRNGAWILLWPAAFWLTAFAVPLFAVVVRGINSPSGMEKIITSPYYRGIWTFTFKQALLSAVFSVLFGLPGAYLVGRCRFPGRRILQSVSTVPFVLPPILAVLGFILVFGNSGYINMLRDMVSGGNAEPWRILYSLKAIIMAHVFYNYPLTMRIVGEAWSRLPLNSFRAARSLGAGRVRAFFAVDLPRLIPAILTSLIITFLFCFLSFAVVLVLGGGPDMSTLEVEVYRLVKHSLDFNGASVLALFGSFVTLGCLALYAVLDRRLRINSADVEIETREVRHLRTGTAMAALSYLVPAMVLIAAPLTAVVVNSFLTRATRSGDVVFTLDHWIRLLGGSRVRSSIPLAALIRTLTLGLSVAFVTTITASLTAWYTSRHHGFLTRLTEGLLAIPMGVSSVILGLGYLIITSVLPRGNAPRLAALVAVHTIMALPFSYRLVSGRMREISVRVVHASRASGAGQWDTLKKVILPLSRRALTTSAIFSLALSAGELNSTIILAPGNFTTLPLAIYRMIGAYDISGACALGTVLIIFSAAGFIALDRIGEDFS
ncbi:MAG: iron ABC transporter permease [Spirochaetaceae bacterium]|nr:iron ABC transporter permease [Spirochaetaceae bacterium]